jgi:hypothetical protein
MACGLSLLAGVSCSGNQRPRVLPVPAPSPSPSRGLEKDAAHKAEGYWQDLDDPGYLLGLEGLRLTVAYGGKVREVAGILSMEGPNTRICTSGREAKTILHLQGRELTFHDPFRNRDHRLQRLDEKPPALSLTSVSLPDPSPIGEERVREVQKELFRRSQADQALIDRNKQRVLSEDPPWQDNQSRSVPTTSDPKAEIRLADLTIRNSEYIRNLLLEVGWIDVGRFGYSASNEAFLLVQHSWDVPIIIATLPRLKQDVDRGLMENDTYALMYDRLQLALGLRQRYGTQIARDPQGEAIVLPVEDKAQVDSFRRQIGLIPLLDYVRVFGASEVRFSSECQASQASPM